MEQRRGTGPTILHLARNLAYLSGAEVVSKLVTFAAVAYVARVAGPTDYGRVEYVAAVVLCASLVVDQGFGPFGAREIARDPASTAGVVQEVVTARVLLALGAYALVILPAALLARSPAASQLLLIYGLSLLGTPLLLQWVFQGHDRMSSAAAIQLARQIAYALVVFVLIRTADQVWFVALAEAAGVCAAAVCGAWLLRRLPGAAPRVRPRLSRRLFREGVPIGLSQLFWMVKMFGATIIVGTIARPDDIGLFAGAQRVQVALHAFVFLYFFNLLPSMARASRAQPGVFASLVRRSLHTVLWLGALVLIAWVMLAPMAMRIIYGAAFEPGGVALQWLALVWLIAALSGHYRFGLIASGRQKAEMVTSLMGAMVAIVLIPVGYIWWGLAGAAAALATAEVAIWLSAWWWAQHTLHLAEHTRLLVKPGTAAALALAAAWMVPSPIELRVGAAIATLAVLALALEPDFRHQLSLAWMRTRPKSPAQLSARGGA